MANKDEVFWPAFSMTVRWRANGMRLGTHAWQRLCNFLPTGRAFWETVVH
ncbi:hypothetical protein SESBI_12690 [Sesbania bispinosa]|nr:hypothetical protein SESBI_12690 [Sesbania bispinosa]